VWNKFVDFMCKCVDDGIMIDDFGTDQLALNLYAYENQSIMNVVSVIWNCVPDWQPLWKDHKYYINNQEVKIIHHTSPFRNPGSNIAFAHHHQDVLSELKFKLGEQEQDKYEHIVVDGIDFDVRPGTWDHHIVHTVIASDDYKMKDIVVPNGGVCVDIGAHIGAFSKWIGSRFPDCSIYAFEPDFDNYVLLRRNVGELKNIIPFCAGLTSNHFRSQIKSLSADNTGQRLLDPTHDVGNTPCIPISKLIESIGSIFMIKIDCEGGEWDLLEHAAKSGARIICGERHDDLAWMNEKLRNICNNREELNTYIKSVLSAYDVVFPWHNGFCATIK